MVTAAAAAAAAAEMIAAAAAGERKLPKQRDERINLGNPLRVRRERHSRKTLYEESLKLLY